MTTATDAAAPIAVIDPRDNVMPKGIWYIISNEFAERFCFYGINSILTVYLVQSLHFTNGNAASWQSLFKSGAYFFPMVGAIVSDVFWGKYRTILVFSVVYAIGCLMLALFGRNELALGLSLALVALGTGGIKPCVATNLGDQFTSKNQHLVERAFSLFYLAINSGSFISIFTCPIMLTPKANRSYDSAFTSFLSTHLPEGPQWAFGVPGVMMALATLVFWAGRAKYKEVPPAGKAWLRDALSPEGRALMLRLAIIYFFVILFWMLWDQSNGNTWTLQAQSSLMDKNLGFGVTVLPAQLQVVNGAFILILSPIFGFGVYPLLSRFTKVTPLRKIGAGLFITAISFIIVGLIEKQILAGNTVSAWWQILAYFVLTIGEVLVSITALEFSYKQAPLRMKSFVMACFYLSISLGNLAIAAVNSVMIKPMTVASIQTGDQTWVDVGSAAGFETNQKIDFTGENGVTMNAAGKVEPLQGTFLVGQVEGSRLALINALDRTPVASAGTFGLEKGASVSTSYLVGPAYFYFFSIVVLVMGVLYVFVAMRYQEQVFMRTDEAPAAA